LTPEEIFGQGVLNFLGIHSVLDFIGFGVCLITALYLNSKIRNRNKSERITKKKRGWY
jgi:hypothetical protein